MSNLSESQLGILAPLPAHARYLVFSLVDESRVREALRVLREQISASTVVGFSESLVESCDANIPGLKPFPSLAGPGVEIPASQGSLWIWLRDEQRGALVHEMRRLTTLLSGAFELIHVVDAFNHGGRDLTGYEDGTENPEGEAAVAAALVAQRGAGLNGSSFVAVQQWVHDLKRFDSMSSHDQDNSVGRQRIDNEELEDAPESAHVKRTAQENFSPEAFVWRRSMPWANEMRHGLMFVAFGHSFDAFEAQLRRMTGLDDGIVDALFNFTRPITGHYFWCPPLKDGRLDLTLLGL